MNHRVWIALASAGLLSFQSVAGQITFDCRAKVKEATPGTAYKAGLILTDTFVFDEAGSTLSIPRGQTLKAQATSSAIAAKASPTPGVVLTISIARDTGGYVTTLTKPGFNMIAEGKCAQTIGDVRTAGAGSVKDNVYTNPYFGMTIRAPSGWRVLGQDESRRIAASAMTENIPVMMMVAPNADKKTPAASIALMIEERRSKVTLEDLVGVLRKGSDPDGDLGPVQAEPLGGRAYSSYRWIGRKDGKEMWMRYYARLERGHYLIFVATAGTEADLLAAERMLREMQRN